MPDRGPGKRVERSRIRRTEAQLPGARGETLFRREWIGPDPERSLLLVHGLAEHSGRYEHFGAWFAERGCAVHAYDQFGHGRSDGPRGHIRKFSDFLDDLEVMLAFVRSTAPERPIVLLGHSMGGLIVTGFASERAPDVAGVVISSGALQLGDGVSRVSLTLANLLAPILPRIRFDAGLDPAGLSRSEEVVQAYRDDPLVFEKITLSLAKSLFGAMQRVETAGARIRVPLLLLHGEDDPMCPVEGSRALQAQRGEDAAALEVYPGLLHEIFNEPEHERVFEDLLEWVVARSG
jgi:alpha-beta hydrolase superfamily lysophospholipase